MRFFAILFMLFTLFSPVVRADENWSGVYVLLPGGGEGLVDDLPDWVPNFTIDPMPLHNEYEDTAFVLGVRKSISDSSFYYGAELTFGPGQLVGLRAGTTQVLTFTAPDMVALGGLLAYARDDWLIYAKGGMVWAEAERVDVREDRYQSFDQWVTTGDYVAFGYSHRFDEFASFNFEILGLAFDDVGMEIDVTSVAITWQFDW